MPDDKALQEDGKSSIPTVFEMQEKLHTSLLEKFDSKEQEVQDLKDQKRMWQVFTFTLFAIFLAMSILGYYLGAFKSQDYIDRVVADADVNLSVTNTLHLQCKMMDAMKMADPICVNLGEQIDAVDTESQGDATSQTIQPAPAYEFKFMGKGPPVKLEPANAPVAKLSIEKVIEDDVASTKQAAGEEEATVTEEQSVVEAPSDEEVIDVDKLREQPEAN